MNLPRFEDSSEYYGLVARSFDAISGTYDDVEGENPINRRLRQQMQAALFRSFKTGSRVLDIGCGSGIDALALANSGVEVLATDISQRMVDLVKKKAGEMRIENVACRRLPAHQIDALVEEFGEGSFDGAYSDGGVLNFEPRLEHTAQSLARLLRTNGRFICSVVNQASLFETVFYPLVLKPRKAFRRLGRDVPVPITRHPAHRRDALPTRFYSPRAFLRYFDSYFSLSRLKGMQVFLPPWNFADEYARFTLLARAVELLEDRLADKSPFNEWGNVFLAELERRS